MVTGTRNQRRIAFKQKAKQIKEMISGFDPLKKFVYKGLQNGTLTREDLVQFAKYFLETEMTKELAVQFLTKEVLSEMSDELAINHLKDRFNITAKERTGVRKSWQ